jgi:hypothetical protein
MVPSFARISRGKIETAVRGYNAFITNSAKEYDKSPKRSWKIVSCWNVCQFLMHVHIIQRSGVVLVIVRSM